MSIKKIKENANIGDKKQWVSSGKEIKLIPEEGDTDGEMTDYEIEIKPKKPIVEETLKPNVTKKGLPRKEYVLTEARKKQFDKAREIRMKNIEDRNKEKKEFENKKKELEEIAKQKQEKRKNKQLAKIQKVIDESSSDEEQIIIKKKPKKKIIVVEDSDEEPNYKKVPVKKMPSKNDETKMIPRQIFMPQFI